MQNDNLDIEDIRVDELLGKGPKGAAPSPAESVDLSMDQIETLREANYTVTIVFHYLQGTWTKLQRKGLEERFGELGIEIEGIYGSEFDANKQSEILTEIAATDTDAVISIPVDTVETADAHQAVSEAGIEVVFMDNVPDGFEHDRDYAGCVSSDGKGVGVVAGRFLREFVGAGNVGMINFDAPFYVTNQREIGVREVLEESSAISVVTEAGFTDPYNVEGIAREMLRDTPDLDGLFVSWADPPGMQATKAVKEEGPSDLIITTTGLSSNAVQEIAQGGLLKGSGTQFPYQQGIIEANMVGQSLLGNGTPQFIASGSLPVYRGNLVEQYPKYYQKELPSNLLNVVR